MPHPFKNIDISLCRHLYLDEELSSKQIAKRLDCSPDTIARRLKDIGCFRSLEERREIANRKKRVPLDLKLVVKLYIEQKLTCLEIARRFKCSYNTIRRALYQLNYLRSNSEAINVAYANGHRKSGRAERIIRDDYVYIWVPGHHLADGKGYVSEHRLAWEETHNRSLPKGWVVHHVNGIKADNRPDNLVAYPKSKHDKVIPLMAERIRRLEIENRQLKRALEDSQAIFYVNEN